VYFLKSRALSLDLSTVGKHFHDQVQDEYENIVTLEDARDNKFGFLDIRTPLQVVMDYFQAHKQTFANVIAGEYVKFLVVKCVEVVAAHQVTTSNNNMQVWKEPCRPCPLVTLFWKTHMLFPKKYIADCYTLLGPLLSGVGPLDCIMDNDDCTSIGPYNNNYWSKRSLLFHFESQLAHTDSWYGRFGEDGMPPLTPFLFEQYFDVVQMAQECRNEQEDDL